MYTFSLSYFNELINSAQSLKAEYIVKISKIYEFPNADPENILSRDLQIYHKPKKIFNEEHMTLTLICIIAYLFAWAYQNVSKKIKLENTKRMNKTNLELQAKIRAQIQIKVLKEWEVLKTSLFSNDEKIRILYRKFGIPQKADLQDTPLKDHLNDDSLSELIRAITMREMHRLGYKYFYGINIRSPTMREKICNENPLRSKYPWL